jgi:hypothetical protein
MADILANPVEICFGSFMEISTTLAVETSPTTAVKAPTTPTLPAAPNPTTLFREWSASST